MTASNGNMVAHYECTLFGSQATATGRYTENSFRFSYEYFDTATELVYYNYRYYDAQIGRWFRRDPIAVIAAGLYGLVKNDPDGYYDHLGLICVGSASGSWAENIREIEIDTKTKIPEIFTFEVKVEKAQKSQ